MNAICAYCLSYAIANQERAPYTINRGTTDRARNMLAIQCSVQTRHYNYPKIQFGLAFPTAEAFAEFVTQFGDEFDYSDSSGRRISPIAVTMINGTMVCIDHIPNNLNYRHLGNRI